MSAFKLYLYESLIMYWKKGTKKALPITTVVTVVFIKLIIIFALLKTFL